MGVRDLSWKPVGEEKGEMDARAYEREISRDVVDVGGREGEIVCTEEVQQSVRRRPKRRERTREWMRDRRPLRE